MPSHPDRVRRNYKEMPSPEERIKNALHFLDYYAAEDAHGDAVLYAKAALLGISVDELIYKENKCP